ncbi:restriction endonuclease subunit S [Ruminococcus flavefaciens]|uniref:restriction endonuclease subunit S n=1 Tax=Ruminococcus flavefaciens TaxID=1265 RepID=UPI0026F0E848|nr:restriction endonuclease subunit S [Ruminococcus flavefaciens]
MKFETHFISELIDEISMGPFGSNIKVECFVDDGVPVLNGSNLEGYELKEDSFRYVTEEKADSLNKANAYRGDVVITHRGTLGQIVFIPQTSKYERYVISQSQFRIRCNDKILPEYMVYYFHTRIGQHKLLSNASQVGVPALARPSTTFQKIDIEIPDIDTQSQIVAILQTIHDKIVVNTTINENLEQQAYLLLEQILSTPHDDICTLSDIANINPRYTLSKGTEARYIDMSQLSTTTSFPDGWTFRPYNGGMKFRNKDTIMARITPCLENGKTAYIDFLEEDETAFGSTEYIVLSPKDNVPSELLYCIVRYPEFRTYATINMNGSSGRQRVSGEIIGKYEIPSFTQEELSAFGAVAKPLFKQITENSLQNRNLSALRDTLLPKLMNGEIDVSAVRI